MRKEIATQKAKRQGKKPPEKAEGAHIREKAAESKGDEIYRVKGTGAKNGRQPKGRRRAKKAHKGQKKHEKNRCRFLQDAPDLLFIHRSLLFRKQSKPKTFLPFTSIVAHLKRKNCQTVGGRRKTVRQNMAKPSPEEKAPETRPFSIFNFPFSTFLRASLQRGFFTSFRRTG